MANTANSRVSNALTGIAGVHYVVSELSRRGLVAMPTIRNTPGIDVLVAEPDGSSQAVLQVKTSREVKTFQEEKRQWWPTSKPDRCLIGPNAFYVFLRYRQDRGKFEVFLESADAVVEQIRDNLEEERKMGHTDFPCWGLPKSVEEQERLAENWRTWRPPKANKP